MQKTNQREFKIEKVIKKKDNKLYVKWKACDNSFNSWINKERYCYIKMSYFPPYIHDKKEIKVELDLSNYATKSDLRNAAEVDTLRVAKSAGLVSLNSEVDGLHIDEFKKSTK